jgi:hypothetical protein
MTGDHSISGKVKEYLERKLCESTIKIKKLKRKRKINKVLIITTVGSSLIISAVIATVSVTVMPPIVITVLSIGSMILTGINARINFQDRQIQITREIEKFNKIQGKLDYVVSCNGDLTKEEHHQILNEF